MTPTMITNAIEKIDPSKLKIKRTEANLTHTCLSSALDVTPKLCSQWETGAVRVAKKHWARICTALRCDIMELGNIPLKTQLEDMKRANDATRKAFDKLKHEFMQKAQQITRLQDAVKHLEARRDELLHQRATYLFNPTPKAITNTPERVVLLTKIDYTADDFDPQPNWQISIYENAKGKSHHFAVILNHEEANELYQAFQHGEF